MFNLEEFDIKLDTESIGRNFIYCDEVESTNAYLLDRENKINRHGTVVLAEKQNKGKGRKDRVWYSTRDQNLTFSILLTSKSILNSNLNILNFTISLAVAHAIENLYQVKAELKWPNDILLGGGKKACGILMESTSEGNKIERLVVGIGINVNQTLFQGNYSLPPTSIKLEANQNIERERLLAEILNLLEPLLEKSVKQPGEILKDWKNKCSMIGDKISIMDGDNVKYGIFDDVDENGFLLLRTQKGKIEKIMLGDVSIR